MYLGSHDIQRLVSEPCEVPSGTAEQYAVGAMVGCPVGAVGPTVGMAVGLGVTVWAPAMGVTEGNMVGNNFICESNGGRRGGGRRWE